MKVVPRKQVLIVDDERINRQMLSIFLGDAYDLSFADTIEVALDLIENRSFHLIITDIRMGYELAGMDVLKRARSSKFNHDVPVVAYTASDSTSSQLSFEEEGFDGHIAKPVTKMEFLKYVQTILK